MAFNLLIINILCMYRNGTIKLYIFVILMLSCRITLCSACSLALHDWQLKLFFKIPINAPFIPLSEIAVIQSHFKKAVTDRIFWVTKPGVLSPYLDFIISFVDGWASQAKWKIVADNKSVIKLAKSFAKDENKPLIVGSDKNFLKVAVFLDANSKNNCVQIVLAQDSRIRCIFQDPQNPWAQEFNVQSWFSLIFYKLPIPGNILSFSAYPVDGNRASIYEDHPLVESLLSKKCLMRRPDLVVDPYSFDFPDLPE